MLALLFTPSSSCEALKPRNGKKLKCGPRLQDLSIRADSTQNLDFLLSIIENNNTVPVILTDGSDNIIATRNIEQVKIEDSGLMGVKLEKMKSDNDPIIIDLGNGYIEQHLL